MEGETKGRVPHCARRSTHVIWLAVVLTTALVVTWGLRRLKGATVYLSHSHGYRAVSFGTGEDDKLQPVFRERDERILKRFVQGDLFDELCVSLVKGPARRRGAGQRGRKDGA